MTTDAFGFTPQVLCLLTSFDRNWNHVVGDKNAAIPGTNDGTGQPIVVDEDSCADGIDNDGDTYVDNDDTDCINGRERPFYTVEAFKFGSGRDDFSYVLSGPIDDIINLENLRPSVSVNEPTTATPSPPRSGSRARHGRRQGPYANDNTAQQAQFGLVKRVEIQPPGSSDWFYASDASGSSGDITMENHPFKDWVYEWDGAAHPKVRATSPSVFAPTTAWTIPLLRPRSVQAQPRGPSLLVDVPTEGSEHRTSKVMFQGTASDPYQGTAGSDVKQIWFSISGPADFTQQFFIQGSTSWSYQWDVGELPRVTIRPLSGLLIATIASVSLSLPTVVWLRPEP